MRRLLDNITWHTLSGPHAKYSTGTDDVRRYVPGFSPIVGFADVTRPNFEGLARYCEPGEHFYCDGWSSVVPAGWNIDNESTMFKMVWEGAPPTTQGEVEMVRLG